MTEFISVRTVFLNSKASMLPYFALPISLCIHISWLHLKIWTLSVPHIHYFPLKKKLLTFFHDYHKYNYKFQALSRPWLWPIQFETNLSFSRLCVSHIFRTVKHVYFSGHNSNFPTFFLTCCHLQMKPTFPQIAKYVCPSTKTSQLGATQIPNFFPSYASILTELSDYTAFIPF